MFNVKKTVSFRVEDSNLIELEHEASKHLITTNQLVNQIINNYLIWERHVRKLKFIPVSDELIIQFLKNSTDEKNQDISKMAYYTIKDIALHAFKVFDFNSFSNTFKAYCIECGFQIDDKIDDNMRHIIINHTLGIEFSYIIKQIFGIAFKEFNITHSCDQTSNTVLINIDITQ